MCCTRSLAVLVDLRRAGMDPEIRAMVTGVHGPLLTALAKLAVYHDAAAVDLFRSGGPLVGALAVSGKHSLSAAWTLPPLESVVC